MEDEILLKENMEDIKNCYDVLKNICYIKKHINTYGITEEGLSFYNEDDQLSEALNMVITTDTDVTLVVEGLSEQISKIKEKIKEKWERFKKSFEKKKEKAATVMGQVEEYINETENLLKRTKFSFNNNEVVKGISYNSIKTLLNFVLKFEIDLGDKNSIKKTKSGIMWLDLTKFKDRAKIIGDEFKSLPQKWFYCVFSIESE